DGAEGLDDAGGVVEAAREDDLLETNAGGAVAEGPLLQIEPAVEAGRGQRAGEGGPSVYLAGERALAADQEIPDRLDRTADRDLARHVAGPRDGEAQRRCGGLDRQGDVRGGLDVVGVLGAGLDAQPVAGEEGVERSV